MFPTCEHLLILRIRLEPSRYYFTITFTDEPKLIEHNLCTQEYSNVRPEIIPDTSTKEISNTHAAPAKDI